MLKCLRVKQWTSNFSHGWTEHPAWQPPTDTVVHDCKAFWELLTWWNSEKSNKLFWWLLSPTNTFNFMGGLLEVVSGLALQLEARWPHHAAVRPSPPPIASLRLSTRVMCCTHLKGSFSSSHCDTLALRLSTINCCARQVVGDRLRVHAAVHLYSQQRGEVSVRKPSGDNDGK